MVDSEQLSILISFIVYLFFMLAIGFFFYYKTKNISDYILGGRGLNSWVTSMSAQASDMSGWLLLGLPGYAYLAGMEAFWLLLGLITGTYINWRFVAERLRKYTETAGNSITLPNYFQNRFKAKTKTLRMTAAIFIIIFFLIYTASGFVAGAKLFSTVFSISYFSALATGAAVIISYTFLGGFLAVSWTDFVQGTIMFFAIIIVPIVVLESNEGLVSTIHYINLQTPEFLNPLTTADGSPISWITVVSLLAWGLGYYGQPHILARFMAIKHHTQVKKARRIAMIWVVFSLFAAMGLGIIGTEFIFPELTGPDSEKIFMLLIHEYIPPIFAGVLLSAILAAVMSTADSQLLVASSALTEDIYRVVIKREASEKELVWLGRAGVIGVAAVAFIFALDPESSVLELVAYAWAGFGAAFGPLIFLSLYWKRMTAAGAIAGIITGGITVLIWKLLSGGIFDLYEIVPGFLLSVIAIVVTSLLDSEPLPAVKEEFDKVNGKKN